MTHFAPKEKKLLGLSLFFLIAIRLLYLFSFPLNFGGDASVYYTMILEKKSHLLMASGYPFLMLLPFHGLRSLSSFLFPIPEDLVFSPWWQSSELRGDLVSSLSPDAELNWMSLFQNHDFLLFQHSIQLLAILCAFVLARKYFGFLVGLLTLWLYGLCPLSLEWPSSSLPEWLQGALLVFWFYFADKSRHATFGKKLLLYAALGTIGAFAFLVKFNSLPVFALLFAGLLLWDWHGYRKAFGAMMAAVAPALLAIGLFVASYHRPTTGTSILSMNSWVLACKCFQFLPEPYLSFETGIHSKRIQALVASLPEYDERLSCPSTYFTHLNCNPEERIAHRNELLWLMRANDEELNSYLASHPSKPIAQHDLILPIAYYIGLEEYSSLLKGMYKDMVKKYPVSFLRDTLQSFFRSFTLKDSSYFFGPAWNEVQAGNNHAGCSRFGFEKFRWPAERHICYHENAVWAPGAWFFSECRALWPSTRWFWFFAFISFAVALKSSLIAKKQEPLGLVLSLFSIILVFVWLSNCVYTEFRLKEFEFIRMPVTLLATLGFYQSVKMVQHKIRELFYRFKIRKLEKIYAF